MTATTHAGPLPAPQVLADYNAIVPGSAESIIGEFQSQSLHRRSLERFVVISDAIRAQIGQLMGGAVALYMIYSGSTLLEHGKSLEGFGSIGTAIALGAIPFAVRYRQQQQEREAQTAAAAEALKRR
jgi:uncharacterized membrane protein